MRWMLILALLLATLAGCTDDAPETEDDDQDAGNGGDNDTDPGTATNETQRQTVEITITWDGAYVGPATSASGAGYAEDSVTVPANSTVVLTFVNNDPAVAHDIAVEGYEDAGADSDNAGAGSSIEITFDVGAPGETKFYCTIPGHRNNGMEGTFIVE